MERNFRGKMAKTLGAMGAAFVSLIGHASYAQEVRLTPNEVVQRALRQNLELEYERQNPTLSGAPQSSAEAQFDPVLFASAQVAAHPARSPRRVRACRPRRPRRRRATWVCARTSRPAQP